MGQTEESLAEGVFFAGITLLPVIIFIFYLLNIFILHLNFKLLDGFVYPNGSHCRVGAQ